MSALRIEKKQNKIRTQLAYWKQNEAWCMTSIDFVPNAFFSFLSCVVNRWCVPILTVNFVYFLGVFSIKFLFMLFEGENVNSLNSLHGANFPFHIPIKCVNRYASNRNDSNFQMLYNCLISTAPTHHHIRITFSKFHLALTDGSISVGSFIEVQKRKIENDSSTHYYSFIVDVHHKNQYFD